MKLLSLPLFAAACASVAVAQVAESPNLPLSAAARNGSGLQTEAGHLLGCGADYRVVFDRDGMMLTPAFGKHAPREFPWRFALTSIERGGEVVYECDGVSQCDPVRADRRASYARTADITECYDVTPEGVEQSFVFARPLPGHGELVVRGTVQTDLQNDFRGESRDGLVFGNAFGNVTVGGVTGIDASGARAIGTLRFDGQSLELVLPGSFVDGAAYPLVLDPLVGADTTASDSILQDDDADIAYDETSDQYAVVWTRSFAVGTSDVMAQRLLSSGHKVGNAYVLGSGGFNENPSIGNSNHSNRFLCVWESSNALMPQPDLAMRALNTDASMSNAVFLVNMPGPDREPDVSNETGGGDEAVLVVWSRTGSGIRGAEVSLPTGNADPSIAGSITDITTNANDSEPAVSKGGGVGDRHAVVWTRQGPNSTNVLGVAVRLNAATVLGTPLPIATFVDQDEQSADVDGDGDDFLVVFECAEGAGATTFDICCRRVTYDGSTLVNDGTREWVEDDAGSNERTPAVGLAEGKYLVAWSEFVVGGDTLRGVALNPVDSSRFGEEFLIEGPRANDRTPEIATQFSAGQTGDQSGDAMIAFTSRDNAWISNTSQVQVQRYTAFGGGAVTTIHLGCGGGGSVSIDDPFASGNDVALILLAADPGAQLAALHIADNSTPIVPCEACWILTPLIAVPDTINNGAARVDLTIDASPDLLGTAWRFQYVVANTVDTPCLGLPVGLSEVVEAVVDY